MFETIFTVRRYASTVYAVIVCPFVHLSVRHKSEFYENVKPNITQTVPYDSPGTLVYWCQRCWRSSNGVTPNRDAK